MTLSNQTRDFLQARLDHAGITTAVVVDDAFDTPTVDRLQNEVSDFWNLIEREGGLYDELARIGVRAASEDEIDDDAIAMLWSKRAEDTPLIEHANRTLFANPMVSLENVERIVESLEELGLEVKPIGTEYDDPHPVASLVFMDYYLGDHSDPDSPERSARRAREIYDSAADDDKPFIVLMSSLPEVRLQAERFREDSDLLGGLFDFVSKDDLNDPKRFALRVATWTSNMPLRHKIQEFIEALDSTLCDRVREFMNEAKSLTIEDYAFVQVLSLQDDGHPLGDYMQWLFSSLLVNKVLEKNGRFTESKEEINRITADSQPPSQLFPSNQLAEIYSIAIAEQDLRGIESHPAVNIDVTEETSDADSDKPDEDSSPRVSSISQVRLPMLRLGDLLVHDDGRRVYMIATPDCDLQFAPKSGRVPEDGESVMLVPGELRPLREPIGRSQTRTELYFHDGEQCRIAWERKKIVTVPVAEFLDWCSDNGYSRPARIRLPYAVKIQQEVIAGFSRVGMPVSPPLQDFVPVEVYSEGTNGTWEPQGSMLDPGVNVIFTDQGVPTYVLTPVALDELLGKLNTIIGVYSGLVQDDLGKNRKKQLISRINRLIQCVEEPENLVQILEERQRLPDSGRARQLVGNTIGLHRNGDFSDGCGNNHLVCLNIVY